MLFQFTRPRGARPPVALCLRTRHRFNSRAHEGRDAIRLNAAGLRVVSIHAPTRGATKMKISYIKLAIVSIHAPTRGATAGGLLLHPRANRFNSRAHEGRDGDRDRLGQGGLCFNSRAHEGRDTYHQKLTGEIAVSIHAPTRGATPSAGSAPSIAYVSIHAPTRGATCRGCTHSPPCPFQFTRPRGARRAPHPSAAEIDWFQFTRPRGARPLIFYHILSLDRKGDFREPWPFSGLFSLIVNDQVFCARRERPILLPRTS